MTPTVRDRLKERTLDTLDWIDIRPEPHWWPALALPAMVGLAYYTLPPILLNILLVGACLLFVAMVIGGIVAGIGFLVCRAVADVIAWRRRERRRQAASSQHLPTFRRHAGASR